MAEILTEINIIKRSQKIVIMAIDYCNEIPKSLEVGLISHTTKVLILIYLLTGYTWFNQNLKRNHWLISYIYEFNLGLILS